MTKTYTLKEWSNTYNKVKEHFMEKFKTYSDWYYKNHEIVEIYSYQGIEWKVYGCWFSDWFYSPYQPKEIDIF